MVREPVDAWTTVTPWRRRRLDRSCAATGRLSPGSTPTGSRRGSRRSRRTCRRGTPGMRRTSPTCASSPSWTAPSPGGSRCHPRPGANATGAWSSTPSTSTRRRAGVDWAQRSSSGSSPTRLRRHLDDPDRDHRVERGEPAPAPGGRLPGRRAAGADRAARRRLARHGATRASASLSRVSVSDTGSRQDGEWDVSEAAAILWGTRARREHQCRTLPGGRIGTKSAAFPLDTKRCLTPLAGCGTTVACGPPRLSRASGGTRRRRCDRRSRTSSRRRPRPAARGPRSGCSRGRTPGRRPPG